jgi:hypothetical protein
VAGPSQAGVDFVDFGRLVYPRLVGTLVLCGMEPATAVRHVVRVVRRELNEGLGSGTAATRLVVQRALESAVPPPVTRECRDEVERALAPLPWRGRLATVSHAVLGPDAAAVRKLGPPDTGLVPPAVLVEAVDARAPAPVPDLLARVRRRTTHRWVRAVIIVIAVVVGVVIATIFI